MSVVLDRLRERFGRREWKRWGRGVDALVETILSQNTNNQNSGAAFRNLKRTFKTWTAVMNAPVDELAESIRVSGLSNQKAPRIQAILRQIKLTTGKLDLEFLADMDDRAAFDYLMGFNGVGPKTAYCVLMFSFRKAVFPVDTHIHRIGIRLALIPQRSTAEQAHDLLAALIAPADRYEAHLLLIEHGRAICRAINPKCDECPLLSICPTGQLRQRRGVASRAKPPTRRTRLTSTDLLRFPDADQQSRRR